VKGKKKAMKYLRVRPNNFTCVQIYLGKNADKKREHAIMTSAYAITDKKENSYYNERIQTRLRGPTNCYQHLSVIGYNRNKEEAAALLVST
jgi:hypothetical protein